jgi:hypothetical protein
MFLLDVSEESRIAEVPLAAGTAELALRFFLVFDHNIGFGRTVLTHSNSRLHLESNQLTHQLILSLTGHPSINE